MSKQEESRLNKIKQFLGIKGGKGATGFNVSTAKPPSKEFIITAEILQVNDSTHYKTIN